MATPCRMWRCVGAAGPWMDRRVAPRARRSERSGLPRAGWQRPAACGAVLVRPGHGWSRVRVGLIGPLPPALGGSTPGGVATHQMHLAAGLAARDDVEVALLATNVSGCTAAVAY